MKLLKLVTLTLALNSIVPSTHCMEQALAALKAPITIEHINAQRVQAAYEAYAYEAQWAPTVRYAALGAVTAIAAYGIYTWFKKPTLSPEAASYINGLSKEERNKFFTDAVNTMASLKKAAETKNTKQPWSEWASENGTSILSWATFTSGLAALQNVNAYAQAALAQHIPTIPTTGNLQWYINARTDYERNVSDIQRYMKYYAVYKTEIHDVMQLIVLDVEKIVGYLNHLNTTLIEIDIPKTVANHHAITCQRYINNITAMTNDMVDAFNTDEQLPVIIEKLVMMLSEVNSAKLFVNAYYR